MFFDFHHSATHAGRAEATKFFYSATMENTNNNIVEWLAAVPRRAKILTTVGGRADASDQLSVLVGGLLPEFKPLITILQNNRALTLLQAQSELLDYATTNGLLETKKTGRANQRDKAFSVTEEKKTGKRKHGRPTEKVDEPCRKFKQGRCNWGKDCRFTHSPEAAVNSAHAGQAQGREAATDGDVPDYPQYEASTFSVSTGATATTIEAANKAVQSTGHVTDFKSELNASSKGSPVDSYGRPIIDDSNDGSFMGFKDGLFNFALSAFSRF